MIPVEYLYAAVAVTAGVSLLAGHAIGYARGLARRPRYARRSEKASS